MRDGTCPDCGARTPAGAERCPSCGVHLGDDLAPVAAGGDGGGQVVELAPGPLARRPWLVAGAVAVVLLAGSSLARSSGGTDTTAPPTATSSTSTSRPRPRLPPPPPTTTTLPAGPWLGEPVGTRLVLTSRSGNRVTVVDPDAGTFTESGPVLGSGSIEPIGTPPGSRRLAVMGDRLVALAADGRVISLSLADLAAPPVELGQAVYFLPSRRQGRVWLVQLGPPPVVREVDVGGRTTAGPVPLPVDRTPSAAVEGGFVVSYGSRTEVWELATGALRPLAGDYIQLLAAAGSQVVWAVGCQPPLCAVHVTDVRTGADRVVYPSPAVAVFAGEPSPDGGALAVVGSDGRSEPKLVVVDLRSGRTDVLDDQFRSDEDAKLAWSPSGGWLFALEQGRIQAWKRGTWEHRELPLPRFGGALLVAG